MQTTRITVTRGAGELVLAPPHLPPRKHRMSGLSVAIRRAGGGGCVSGSREQFIVAL